MSISDTNQAKRYASIAEVAAAEAKIYADKLEAAPDYAEQASLSAESALASSVSASESASSATLSENAASDFATQAAASAADAGSAAASAIARSVKVPAGESLSDLPPAASRVNSVIIFNSGANSAVKPLSDFAILDPDGKIPASAIPAVALSQVFVVNSQAAMLALTAQEGDIAKRTDLGLSFVLAAEPASTLSNWIQVNDDVLAQLSQSNGASMIGYNAETLEDVADRVDLKINGANTFSAGATLSSPKDFIWDAASSTWYYWSGSYPKTVAASSSPSSTGGISPTAWSPASSSYLQSLLIAANGVNYVNGAVKTVATFAAVKSGSHANALYLVTIEHHAGGLGGASYQRTGTTGTPSSGDESLCYDADGVGWKMVKQPIHSPRQFGFLGNGTDDLAACKRTSNFVGQNGGGRIFFESLSGKNDGKISNNWDITYSGVSIDGSPDVHIHTEAATTDGHCIAFIGDLATASGRIKQVGIRGIKVSANGSTNLDNAIGFAGCDGFWATNLYIPHADRKGVTAQVNVVNGVFKDIIIDSTNYDAVTIEGDTVNNSIISQNFVVENVTVTSAGRDGLHIAGASTTNLVDRVVVKNFRCDSAVASGVNVGLCQNILIDDSTRVNNSGVYGFNISAVTDIKGRLNTLNSQNAGVVITGCSRVNVKASITNAGISGSSSANPWDALYLGNASDPYVVNAEVYGSTHRYLINSTGTAMEHIITFPRPGLMPAGSSGVMGGNVVQVVVQNPGEQTTTSSGAPSVVGIDSIYLAPSSASNYTGFTGGVTGKVVNARFNGSATMVSGSTIGTFRLKGGANVTPVAGSMMSFIYTAEGFWREIARNF
ncbi:hypothetical protein ACOIOT_003422 [Cronobacter turicensis]